MFQKQGFTLIELLVVVLIIGILSAVALPQYQIAVLKSKMNSVLPLLRAVKDANEAYYMANGTYTDDLNALDITVPAGNADSHPWAGLIMYDNGTWMDQYVNTDAPAGNYRVFGGVYDPAVGRGKNCTIFFFYDYSTESGKRSCGGNYPHCARVCKSLGF